MAQSRTQRAEGQALLDHEQEQRKQHLLILIAVAVVLVAGSIGWWLSDAVHRPGTVHATVTDSFTGTIGYTNTSGTSGCVKVDGSSRSVCGQLVAVGNNPVSISSGTQVRAAYTTFWTGGGSGFTVILLYPLRS